MKNKKELLYSTKQELIGMIVKLWDDAPTYVSRQRIMEFLISSYRDLDLTKLDTLKEMSYDDLEKMYITMQFLSNEGRS